MDKIKKAAGRPRTHEALDIVALFCNGANRGESAKQTARMIAAMMADKADLPAGRQRTHQIDADAANIERYRSRYRTELLLPWSPKPGEGVLKGVTRQDLTFHPFMFNGRPLPLPIGLEPREAPKRGRPKK